MLEVANVVCISIVPVIGAYFYSRVNSFDK